MYPVSFVDKHNTENLGLSRSARLVPTAVRNRSGK